MSVFAELVFEGSNLICKNCGKPDSYRCPMVRETPESEPVMTILCEACCVLLKDKIVPVKERVERGFVYAPYVPKLKAEPVSLDDFF